MKSAPSTAQASVRRRRIAPCYRTTPFWGADDFWQWKEGTLPADAASKLAGDWPLFFYQSRDDEVVPFGHLALYEAKLPRATFRTFEGRGHQFRNDLTEVAADLRTEYRGSP